MKMLNARVMKVAAMLAVVCVVAPALPVRAADEIPGPPQSKPIAIIGATVHPITGDAIEAGIIVFDKGRIIAVGKDVTLPPDAQVIDAKGKHIYPGLIDAYTDMGLIEINSVRATNDQRETGKINPSARAEVAVNPDSELIPVARSNGILITLTAPEGGWISGTSALIQLDGWTWRDMTVRAPVGLHIDWPRMGPSSTGRNPETFKRQIEQRDETLRGIRQAFADARAYRAATEAHAAGKAEKPRPDARWQAMIPVLEGKVPLIVRADETREIQAAVAFAAQEKVKLIILGGYDAPQCAELLKEHDVPVIIGGTHRLPKRRDDAYDAAYTLPARLHKAGVRFCISGSYRFGASMVRNLPYHAGTAAAYGLPPEEALKSVTLYAAQILGAGDKLGSLEVGKDASLIITDGDPLEVTTDVEQAFIQGAPVDLNNKHKRLWNKYEEKYARQRDAKAENKPAE